MSIRLRPESPENFTNLECKDRALSGMCSAGYLHQAVAVVPIRADLREDTPIPGMEVPFTWQASLELNAKLYSALGQCNLDKAGLET